MEIFAHHAHVFPEEMHFSSPLTPSHGTVSELLAFLDQLQIDRTIAFAPYPHVMESVGKDSNEWLANKTRKEQRLLGFGVVDFRHGVSTIKQQVRKIKGLGLVGIKIHPAVQNINVVGRKAFAAYEAAEEMHLPISFHTGIHFHRIRDDHPLLYDEIAHKFPTLVFSLEHVGGYNFFYEATAVILNNIIGKEERKNCNVYAGLASSFSDSPKTIFWFLGIERYGELLKLIGDDYILFGLDFPYRTLAEVSEAKRIVFESSPNEGSKEKIFRNNLLRFIEQSP